MAETKTQRGAGARKPKAAKKAATKGAKAAKRAAPAATRKRKAAAKKAPPATRKRGTATKRAKAAKKVAPAATRKRSAAAKKAPAARKRRATRARKRTPKAAADRTATLSEELLESLDAGQSAAIQAVRRFVDTVEQTLPLHGDGPSKRQEVVDSAMEMADRLVHTQYDFLRSVVHSAAKTLGGAQDKKRK